MPTSFRRRRHRAPQRPYLRRYLANAALSVLVVDQYRLVGRMTIHRGNHTQVLLICNNPAEKQLVCPMGMTSLLGVVRKRIAVDAADNHGRQLNIWTVLGLRLMTKELRGVLVSLALVAVVFAVAAGISYQ
jgi:hypothetical protein